MKLVVLNEKFRKKSGDLQPIEYPNATYEQVGDLFVISYRDPNNRAVTAKIPREHVAQIMEIE